MENASKALVIAGGVLLAVLTISLLIYMLTTTTRMANTQDEIKVTEQLTAFNKSYEAYNKKRMYGTDIITVVNKAISHNISMNSTVTEEPYYINIIITTKQQFKTTVDEINNSNSKKRTYEGKQIEVNEIGGVCLVEATKVFFGNETTEELGELQKNGKEFILNSDFQDFFEGDTTDKTVDTPDKKTTYIQYSALTNFKRAIFQCTEVKQNELTGRIEEMTFEQI